MSEGSGQAHEETRTVFPQGGTETILLADDDEGVRSVAKIMLRKVGYTVLTASDGQEALRVFDRHAYQIDLALLDVVMPKLGGKAVAEHILAQRPEIPVIFSSGYGSDAIHANFVVGTSVHLIQKPYSRDELLQKVLEALNAGKENDEGRG
ncbi:MAG: response regulator [Acidobacteriota bacterium]